MLTSLAIPASSGSRGTGTLVSYRPAAISRVADRTALSGRVSRRVTTPAAITASTTLASVPSSSPAVSADSKAERRSVRSARRAAAREPYDPRWLSTAAMSRTNSRGASSRTVTNAMTAPTAITST